MPGAAGGLHMRLPPPIAFPLTGDAQNIDIVHIPQPGDNSRMTVIRIEEIEAFPVSIPYLSLRVIARGAQSDAYMVEVRLTAQGKTGRGEAHPTLRYNETEQTVLAAIQAVRPHLLAGCSRENLRRFMRPGPARNAVDCALWDLEAKLTGRRVEDISGTGAMKPVTTVYTLSLLSPRDMEEEAAREAHRPALKVKLGHFADDRARLRGVRRAAPEARLIVDANEGWSFEQTVEMSKVAADCGVVLIEQPVPAGSDGVLKDWRSPVPLCADESCHTRADVDRVADRGYDAINIKLDKSGGLTEALALAEAARARGLGLMVGCMSGTTLAMAPGFVLAQLCQVIDLDSPLYLPPEDAPQIVYDLSTLSWAPGRRWGVP